jgi:predicted kinase
MADKQIICMMGLPRAGKSTVARLLSKVIGAPVVNRDSIRLALHGQRYATEAEPMVRALAKIMVTALFKYHDNIIVDETNLKRETRDFWRGGDHDTSFLYVTTSPELCLERADATNDEEIKAVIQKMDDYAEPLDHDEIRFCVCDMPVVYSAIQEAIGATQTEKECECGPCTRRATELAPEEATKPAGTE